MASNDSYQTRVALTRDRDQIDRLEASILSAIEEQGYPHASVFAIRLALEEAMSNAFRHGNKGLPPDAPIHVEYAVDPEEVRIAVADDGPGFDPESIPDPTLDANLESPSGRGITLIRAYMTDVRFNPRGNRVDMVYERPTAD